MAETTVSEEVTLTEPRKVVADRGGIYRWGSEAELGEEHAITQDSQLFKRQCFSRAMPT